MSHPLYTNRLINEKSPYLLQHAHNPVDWYPWGEEAFRAAKDLDRPIFLSIGYATCHWCHVMEHESFENVEVAKLMNETFINVKIDREEKPEVDSLYMEFAQAMMSGGAGWPLNVILTPDLLPFFAATYLPAEATRGFLGVKQLALRIGQIWEDHEEKENVIAQAGKIVDVFSTHIHAEGELLPEQSQIKEAAEILFKTADPVYGGTKGAPKFPIGIQACFLLHLVKSSSDSRALFYVERTLDMMHRGGIYDHIGGGFSRYTVDERWLVPHFEKMLYDNAILARAYLEAWQFTRHHFYREVVEEILGYVMREMTDPNGGFYSAEDADSEGHEGWYYTWSWDQIHSTLGPEAPLFCDLYGVTPGGNFEGRNILHMRTSLAEYASQHHLEPGALKNILKEMRCKLFEVRKQRQHPSKDDKILTAWNGLMIYAFAEAAIAFNKPEYLNAAEKAALFIQENLWKAGTLLRRWREGEARFDGCLDDYAFLIQGLISLFEADRGSRWLEFALTLSSELQSEFKAENGAFYLTNGRDPNLILRRCEFYDGAEPSGNAVHTENLIRLYQITGIENYLKEAEDVLRAAKDHIDLYPPGACYHLMALERYFDKNAPTLIISLNDEEAYQDEIFKMLAGRYIPHKAVIWLRGSDEELRDLVPPARNKPPLQGKTTLYICYSDRCEEPITDLSKMWKVFEGL
ncbi:MAG: thioredoxin domain-containing protein [Chlamydiales bacterium]|nr:thioredoxin domain-containing protein [Chlamydiales bacterium]